MQILVEVNRPVSQLQKTSRNRYSYITDDTVCNLVENDLVKLSNVLLNCAANSPKLYRRLAHIFNKSVDVGSLYS